jgi:HSP20 family protein
MTSIVRWDPFREMAVLRNTMDRFFEEPFMQRSTLWERPIIDEWSLALDVVEDDDKYTVKASLPGVDPDDIEVTLTDNVLTIKGEMKQDEEVEEKNYHLRERRFGRFTRSIALPATVQADKVEAINENGVLTLYLPKAEEVKPKKIAIRKQIEHKR